jgi:hypothetical protein
MSEHNYYLMYANNQAFVYNAKQPNQKTTLPYRLLRSSDNSPAPVVSTKTIVVTTSINPKVSNPVDLTKAEFDNILKSKPDFEALTRIYSLGENTKRVAMAFSRALPVF